MKETEKRMNIQTHVLAIVQVFEDYIDLNSNALMKEVNKRHIRKNDDNDNTFSNFSFSLSTTNKRSW